jgi:hypothetical protein
VFDIKFFTKYPETDLKKTKFINFTLFQAFIFKNKATGPMNPGTTKKENYTLFSSGTLQNSAYSILSKTTKKEDHTLFSFRIPKSLVHIVFI